MWCPVEQWALLPIVWALLPLLVGLFELTDAPLRTATDRLNPFSLAWASEFRELPALVAAWGPHGRRRVRRSLWIDFALMPVYSTNANVVE